MSSVKLELVFDPERDADLLARLADLARTGDRSATIRAALYAYLFPERRADVGAVLAAIDALRADLRAYQPPASASDTEDPALGRALDEQLDQFFKEDAA